VLLTIKKHFAFGEQIKNIKIQTYQEEMRFPVKKTNFSRHGGKLKPLPLQPVLPLLPEVLPKKDHRTRVHQLRIEILCWPAPQFDDLLREVWKRKI
jgi:hypothetical protein